MSGNWDLLSFPVNERVGYTPSLFYSTVLGALFLSLVHTVTRTLADPISRSLPFIAVISRSTRFPLSINLVDGFQGHS